MLPPVLRRRVGLNGLAFLNRSEGKKVPRDEMRIGERYSSRRHPGPSFFISWPHFTSLCCCSHATSKELFSMLHWYSWFTRQIVKIHNFYCDWKWTIVNGSILRWGLQTIQPWIMYAIQNNTESKINPPQVVPTITPRWFNLDASVKDNFTEEKPKEIEGDAVIESNW